MNRETQLHSGTERSAGISAEALLEAMSAADIYCFKYYPKQGRAVMPENTQRILGCRPFYDGMPESLCDEYVDEEYRDSFNAVFSGMTAGRSSASPVFRFRDMKTWSRITLTVTERDGEGAAEECICVVENISEAKNAELAAVERNRMLKLVMQVFQVAADTADTMVFLFDTKKQSIMVTDNTAGDWGVLTEQTGVPYEIVNSGIVAEESKAEYIRIHEEIINGALKAEGSVQLRDAGGNTGYYELTMQTLLDGNGRPTGKAAGIYRNVTGTVKHEKRQDFIIRSLGHTYSSIYYVDIKSGRYERISEKEVSVIGIPDEGEWDKGYGSYISNFVDGQYRQDMNVFLEVGKYEARLGKNESISVEYQRADKGWRKASMLPAERGADGGILSVIFAVQRIDAEKKKELETRQALKEAYDAAQLASRAKTAFLSNMSHDIRTPMNSIIGMTAIAAANLGNTDKISYCLKNITASSKHLLGLINEVLDMSKIESGRVDLNEECFSLSDMIEELISMNNPLIEEKGHTLTVKIGNPLHENVIGDSLRLQQVFNNLLTNAIKYTPNGGRIEITVEERATNTPDISRFEVTFTDNGIGISEEYQKAIFDPFTRAGDDRIASVQGTGLGMPIARNIIRMMNGDITVKSKINEGSTFTVSFILKLQSEDTLSPKDFADLSVLVADDDALACESTCAILDSLSMKSEWVTSGKEAVGRVAERHSRGEDYNAVIIDWKMPGMNGIDTAKAIRKQVGDEIPIIVLTAYDWSDIEQEAKAAGVNAFLSKPLFKSRIVEMFSRFVTPGDNNKQELPDMPQKSFPGRRILLAEDNELNSEIAVELISMLGVEIETAENGKVCLEKFTGSAAGYYDMIFMDVQMPYMDGYEATAAIRESEHPDAKTVPIIAMTANAFSADVRNAFDSGMNGHISKPIDIDNIIKVFEKHFG